MLIFIFRLLEQKHKRTRKVVKLPTQRGEVLPTKLLLYVARFGNSNPQSLFSFKTFYNHFYEFFVYFD